jgi:hypothetical protein
MRRVNQPDVPGPKYRTSQRHSTRARLVEDHTPRCGRVFQARRSSRLPLVAVLNVELKLLFKLDSSALARPKSICALTAFGLMMLAEPGELPLVSSWFQF